MKKRKEDEEEEGREVTLCWFDEVMQEQLLPLQNKNRETCFCYKVLKTDYNIVNIRLNSEDFPEMSKSAVPLTAT